MNSYNILPQEVKDEIVHLHLSEGRTLDSLAAEYGVAKSSVTRWVKDYREECQTNPIAKGELDKDEKIRLLTKRVAELEKELAFSKKAAAFFAKEII